jgi:Cu+-exporting ATPase
MSCTNCALTVDKFLQGKGMQEVKVNFMGGDVSFEMPTDDPKQELAKGIEGLGYHVVTGDPAEQKKDKRIFKNHFQRFLFCAIFTVPLMLHMIPGVHIHFLMDPYVQLILTIPVFIVGMDFFGSSAIEKFVQGHSEYECADRIGCSGCIWL